MLCRFVVRPAAAVNRQVADNQQRLLCQRQIILINRIIRHFKLSKTHTKKPAPPSPNSGKLQNRLDFVDLHFQAADVLQQPENAENRPKTARRLCCAKDATGKLRWGFVRRLSPPHRGYAPIEKIRPAAACPRTQTRYPYARHCVSAGRMLPATVDTPSPKRLGFGRLLRMPSC